MKQITILTLIILLLTNTLEASSKEHNDEVRYKYNFNSSWLLSIGDDSKAMNTKFDDTNWKQVTLPRAFNEDEAFCKSIEQLTDTVMWYRKHFRLPAESRNKKVFIEFEGVRQAADFYINGKHVGLHENGTMAVGFDLTPYIIYGAENVIALRIDNNWDYRERSTNTKYQWSDRNFNANYGGIPKNVWLHVTNKTYQTLPLYSNLNTTGVYIYADNIQVASRKATIHAQSEIKNEHKQTKHILYKVELIDSDGNTIKSFEGTSTQLKSGETTTLEASAEVDNLHFWSWGYGYLYTVKTSLWVNGKKIDEVATRTGFRKTRFANGMIWLNDRVLQMKGFAQRTSNEWPAVGISVPAWLSDFSNGMMVEGNANLVRWMHTTPSKQDIESCDRVGLLQAMPAGDAEKDREGRQWEQRTELMRDAIIYNRNNPSIIFYECGNESVSRKHMVEMKSIRDKYDPHGGRAIGSREMLDIRESEYGGEMLYINKSKHHPMWAMEYCRNEGLRKYWDDYSYPYHKNGEGPLYRGKDASDYNQNQDMLAIENIRRWYDYWQERPGTGLRVSSGGVKIIFSDTNTHYRGEENYRRSGVTDAMRIPKDAFFAHQVMWDGWVDVEQPRIHIMGHWNYDDGTVKPVYVVSSADRVELLVNGKLQSKGRKEYNFLHTFDDVLFDAGKIEAIGYDREGKETCKTELQTAGKPDKIVLSITQSPNGWKADGADMVLLQAEVVDKEGRRCPLANNSISFHIDGPADWRGGIAQGKDNYILSKELPVECGINRALIRSLTTAGTVSITAKADGLQSAQISISSQPVDVKNGISQYIAANELKPSLLRGETPLTPSYKEKKIDIAIASAVAGANNENVFNSYDDNELSEWKNDGRSSTAWITYTLKHSSRIDEICMKLTGWRMRSYPLEIYADKQLIWSGDTEKSLGYIHLKVKPVLASTITIRLKGANTEEDAFGQIVEVAAPVANELDLYKAKDGDKPKHELRIVEIEFYENLWQ